MSKLIIKTNYMSSFYEVPSIAHVYVDLSGLPLTYIGSDDKLDTMKNNLFTWLYLIPLYYVMRIIGTDRYTLDLAHEQSIAEELGEAGWESSVEI